MDSEAGAEIVRQLREAGLDAWDDVPDPAAYLRQMRGDLTWDERFEGLSRDQLCEVKDALSRAFEKVEEEAGR